MTGRYLVFAALLTVPVSAMLCSTSFLVFFLCFPAAAVIGANWRYCKSLPAICFPPAVFLVWAYVAGNDYSAIRSVRWICALASGTYFATELGTSGIAAVLRSAPSIGFTRNLSDLMLMAGSTASNMRQLWKKNEGLGLLQRIMQSTIDSVAGAKPDILELQPPGITSVVTASVSWVFLLVAVSGVADGIAG